ncbi:NnrU family protein [Rhodomicrobium lacus]|uniref:NnrU family protein n=1 Tax=Rhodomicrobium lacus TaxID=2498452 RepID=UPI0026E1CA09|nr:NnrU family protein [Rhodomicrobium lacus]WKW52401.1 NnrU family protein [Rhodomicrobium lacus]
MVTSSALYIASAAFFALHLLPSTPARPRALAMVGEGVYTAIFSILSVILLWLLAREFNAADYGAKLWLLPAWWLWIKAFLILFAYVLIFAGVLTPNPSSPGSANSLENPDIANGIFAITRHPVMWGVAIWALTHMISQSTWRGFAFFGSFAATALIGSWLQQRRKRASVPGWADFEARTSFFPFLALIENRAALRLKSIAWGPVAVAVIAWGAVLHYHGWIFGTPALR